MFKRSFPSKDRVGKAVKPSKKTYREHAKVKMQESLDSPPVGRYVLDQMRFWVISLTAFFYSQPSHQPHSHLGCGS